MNFVGCKSLETHNVCHLWVHLKIKVPKGEVVEMLDHFGFHKEAFCDSCEEYYNNVKNTIQKLLCSGKVPWMLKVANANNKPYFLKVF